MKILFYLTRYPGIGGIENVTTLVCSHLSREHEIYVLAHMRQEGVAVPQGLKLFHMPDSTVWNAPENYAYADKLMSENRFDSVVYQDSYAPTERIVCQMAEKHHVPLYVFEHNTPLLIRKKRTLWPVTTPKGLLLRLLYPLLVLRERKRKRFLLHHARKYILLSKRFIPEFVKFTGIPFNGDTVMGGVK